MRFINNSELITQSNMQFSELQFAKNLKVKKVMNIKKYKKIIFVHKGALGDFLQIWPTLCNIVEFFKNKVEFYFYGKSYYNYWIRPLNIKPLPWEYRILLDKIYLNEKLSSEFNDSLIIWFILKKNISNQKYHNVIFLKGILKSKKKVWKQYLDQLQNIGLDNYIDWQKIWSFYFKRQSNPNFITIFPGSGHRLKNWPVENFIKLAEILLSMNQKIRFVMGPAELERFDLNLFSKFSILLSQDAHTLQDIILESKLVIGNDSGPMHLAGINQVPNITIFGPTNPELWGPIGSLVISPNINCAPCTSIIDIKCDKMLCLKEITVDMVLDKIKKYFQQFSVSLWG